MDYDNFKTLSVTCDKGVAFVTFNHGELNLIDFEMVGELDRLGQIL